MGSATFKALALAAVLVLALPGAAAPPAGTEIVTASEGNLDDEVMEVEDATRSEPNGNSYQSLSTLGALLLGVLGLLWVRRHTAEL